MRDLDCFGMTDRGVRRSQNEDQFLIADLVKTMQVVDTSLHQQRHAQLSGRSQGKLLVVADGMGGHNAGERASAMAIECINSYVLNMMHWFFRLEQDREHDFEEDLKAALEHTNSLIRAEADAIPGEYNMGTTLTMAYCIWPRLYIVHVGDSRCYLFRHGKLQQLTTDHSYAQQFVERGTMSKKAANKSSWSHVLWNVIGGSEDEITPTVNKCPLVEGDQVLLCTDGLNRCVSDSEICKIMKTPLSPEQKCIELINASLDNGGPDNITVIVGQQR